MEGLTWKDSHGRTDMKEHMKESGDAYMEEHFKEYTEGYAGSTQKDTWMNLHRDTQNEGYVIYG